MTPLARKYIETKALTWLAANEPGTLIQLPNAPFKQPKNALFFTMRILHGDPVRSNIGPHAFTVEPKVMQMDCLVPDDTGSNQAIDTTRRFLRECFHHVDVPLGSGESLRFYTSGISAQGAEAGKYRVIGSANFELRIRE